MKGSIRDGLTIREREVLEKLGSARKLLETLEGITPEEVQEADRLMVQAVRLLSARVVRRDYPNGWKDTLPEFLSLPQ